MIQALNKHIGKLSTSVAKTLGALSPIDLFNRQQIGKLASSRGGPQAAARMGELHAIAKGNLTRVAAAGPEGGLGGIRGYMGGAKMGETGINLDEATRAFRTKVRGRAAMAAGAYLGSSLAFGSDSAIPSTMRSAAKVGMHGGIAAGLSTFAHPMAGVAYAGLGIFNALRSGDNIGPF
jgi:hypothetical protein